MSRNPREVFVGDLSFFCTESDLLNLFQPYCNVRGVHIARSHDKAKSLLYGFVCLESVVEAVEMARIFNGQMFMGRRMRVIHTQSMNPLDYNGPSQHLIFSVHLRIAAPKVRSLPMEHLLRKHCIKYGQVHDVVVREYNFNPVLNQFLGFAFIAFLDPESAFELANTNDIVAGEFFIHTTLSHQPHH